MIENTNNWKYQNDTLLNNLMINQKYNNNKKENSELTKLLKPLKDKIVEIEITKGPISLISSIIELYFDNKKKSLLKEEIYEGIKIKLKKNKIVIFDAPYISFIDNGNIYIKINEIVSFNECFEKIISDNKEYIQLKNKTVNENLSKIIGELIEQYNILTYNPDVSIEIEENEKYKYESFFGNHKINNYDKNEQTK